MKKPIAIGCLVLVLLFIIGVAIFYFVDKANTDKINSNIDKNVAYEMCLRNAYIDYTSRWNKQCTVDGRDKKEEGCTLPVYIGQSFDTEYSAAKDRCNNTYNMKLLTDY